MSRVALIQGVSSGVGQALVECVLKTQEYQKVIVTSRQPFETLSDPNTHPKSQPSSWLTDSRVTLINLDLCNDDSILLAAQQVKTLTNRLHLVVTTAGILKVNQQLGVSPEKKLTDLSRQVMNEVFAVNCLGPFLWYSALGNQGLLRHRDPLIIATLSARVGSIGDNRLGGWYSYRASKAAQNMMTKTLSLELRRNNPHATVIGLHPGTVDTSLSRPFHDRVPSQQLFSPEQATNHLWKILTQLSPDYNGQVLAWDGQVIEP